MAEAQLDITLPPDSETQALALVATVTKDGRPAVGMPVRFHLDGDGTFDAMLPRADAEMQSSSQGDAWVTWWDYPRYEPRRELKSRVTARCDVPGCEIDLEVLMRIARMV